MSDYYVVLPPPYTHADLHIGHLAGVYIPGDIYTRYLKNCGHRVIVLAGADQNNTYTEKKSESLQQPFPHIQELFAQKIEQSLRTAHINFDIFIKTKSERHIHLAKSITHKLLKNQFVQTQTIHQLHCELCQEFCFDNRVHGQCGNCGYQNDAGICENCNTPLINRHLLEPIHEKCGQAPQLKKTRALTFNINKLKYLLFEKIKNSQWDIRIKSKYLDYLCREHIQNPLLTYHYQHGIPIYHAHIDANRLVIWFEAIWCLFTGLAEIYKTDLDGVIHLLNKTACALVPFMAQDSEYYYAIGLSSVLLALGVTNIPTQLSVQRFVKLEGKKFSNKPDMITIDQLLTKYSVDVVRFYSFSILKNYLSNSNEFSVQALEKFNRHFNAIKNHLYQHQSSLKISVCEIKRHHALLNIVETYHAAMQSLQFERAVGAIHEIETLILQDSQLMATTLTAWLFMLKPIMPNTVNEIGHHIFHDQWRSIEQQTQWLQQTVADV